MARPAAALMDGAHPGGLTLVNRPTKPLPEILARIADAAGIETAMRIASLYGGSTIYLPQSVSPECVLARVVGVEAAQRIVGELGYGQVSIPLGPRMWGERASAAVLRLAEQGLSVTKIAREIGTTERTVRRHKEKLRKAKLLPPRPAHAPRVYHRHRRTLA